jgi:hypothetical protein
LNNKETYEYIMDLYAKYKLMRQTYLDDKYEENYNAYHKIDNKDFNGEDWQSQVYVDIAKQKIVAGANLVADMAFKNGIVPFRLQDPVAPDGLPAGDDYAMETLISEQLLRGFAKPELEKTILSASIYGEGFAKFYIADEEQIIYESIGTSFVEKVGVVEEPRVEHVSVWDMFRDIETNDIINSEGIIQRKYVTLNDLKQYENDPDLVKGSLKKALDYKNEYLSETDQTDSPKFRNRPEKVGTIEHLEAWVRVPAGKKEDKSNMKYCRAILAAGQLIKVVDVEKWDIPFYRFEWEENADGYGGIGTADNVGDQQEVLNRAFRTFEDNKHLSSRVMFAGISSYVKNFNEGFKSGGFLEVADVDNVREAVEQFTVADVGSNILDVINLTMQLADMSSNIPRTSQGQESNNPQTAYEIQQRLERAGKYIGRVISNLDYVIEAIVERFYRWNMTDPEVPMSIKVPYDVKATGFASYETRVLKTQKLMQTVQLFTQIPDIAGDYKLDPLFAELIKSNDIDPRLIIKSAEEKQMDAQLAQEQQEIQRQQIDLQFEKQSVDIAKVRAEIKEILNEVNEKRIAGAREELGVDAERKVRQKKMITGRTITSLS